MRIKKRYAVLLASIATLVVWPMQRDDLLIDVETPQAVVIKSGESSTPSELSAGEEAQADEGFEETPRYMRISLQQLRFEMLSAYEIDPDAFLYALQMLPDDVYLEAIYFSFCHYNEERPCEIAPSENYIKLAMTSRDVAVNYARWLYSEQQYEAVDQLLVHMLTLPIDDDYWRRSRLQALVEANESGVPIKSQQVRRMLNYRYKAHGSTCSWAVGQRRSIDACKALASQYPHDVEVAGAGIELLRLDIAYHEKKITYKERGNAQQVIFDRYREADKRDRHRQAEAGITDRIKLAKSLQGGGRLNVDDLEFYSYEIDQVIELLKLNKREEARTLIEQLELDKLGV